jgi:alanyl-tRNA synthetase
VTRELLLQTPADVRVIAVDASEAMIEGMVMRLSGVPGIERLVPLCADLEAVEVGGVMVLAARMDGADAQVLRETMDALKGKLKTAAIVLASVQGDKVSLIAGVTSNAIDRIKAGDLVNFVAQQVGGKGGGKPEMAMAGGTNPAALASALSGVRDWVAQVTNR